MAAALPPRSSGPGATRAGGKKSPKNQAEPAVGRRGVLATVPATDFFTS